MADEKETTYTNLDLGMLKKCVFVRGVTMVERAMISSVVNEIAELAEASSTDLCMTFERVTQMADGSFLGVVLDSPDTRHTTDDLRGKECIRIYVCEKGDVIQIFNVIMSYQGMISLIGDFHGMSKFTLKTFGDSSTSGASVQPASLHKVEDDNDDDNDRDSIISMN